MNDPTFPYRLTLGLLVLAIFLLWDVLKHGRKSRRLKEYAFLALVSLSAMCYGVVHDYVTWRIAPQYYVLGKGLTSASTHFSREVVALALKATWTVGIVGGAVLLLANNPDSLGRTLSFRRLILLGLIPFAMSVAAEIAMGSLFALYPRAFAELLRSPAFYHAVGDHFMIVWGMHIGAYAGGGLGLIVAVVAALRLKHRQAPINLQQTLRF